MFSPAVNNQNPKAAGEGGTEMKTVDVYFEDKCGEQTSHLRVKY